MFSVAKKISIAASLLALYSGQFVAFASNGNNNNDVDSADSSLTRLSIEQASDHGCQPMELDSPTIKRLDMANADAPANSSDLTPAALVAADAYQQAFLTRDIFGLVAARAGFLQCLENKSPVNLALVCKHWREIVNGQMQVNQPCWKAWMGIIGHEDIYERFSKGVLIYRPKSGSDEGMIQLKIADLLDQKKGLCGTFNISQCGDRSKAVVITTDPAVFFNKVDYQDHLMILIAPRFLIAQKLNSTAAQFKGIMNRWSEKIAQVGMFWCVSWNKDLRDYDYLVTSDLDEVSSRNFYKNWEKRACSGYGEDLVTWVVAGAAFFHVCFETKLDL